MQTLEATTPEVDEMSLLPGTHLLTPRQYRERAKQRKAEEKEVRRQALAAALVLTPEDIAQREALWAYIDACANDWHRRHLTRLRASWETWNEGFYASQLKVPLILLNEPTSPPVYGSCARISGYGGRSQIRIRPSLLRGTHPHMRCENAYAEGRFLFVEDVLRHEMIHQWQQEVTGSEEGGSRGHGKTFRDKCNEIGAKLGLAPVRTGKKRGCDAELPSCAQWPHNVRSLEYYQGAYVPPEGLSPVQVLCRAASGFGATLNSHYLVELCNAAFEYYKSTPAYRKLDEREQARLEHLKLTLEDIAGIAAGTPAHREERDEFYGLFAGPEFEAKIMEAGKKRDASS